VRDVVDGRVERLGPSAAPILRAAAVAGVEFELADLEAVLELDPEEGLAVVERALGARLLRESGAPGRYVFSHALVRDALYEATSSARRARLHAQVGLAQAERGASPMAVAEHLLEAAPLVDTETTADWSERAAVEALTAVAYEDAAEVLRRALDRLPDLRPLRRGELLACLGRALDSTGDRDEARRAFRAAAAVARDAGDRSLLAHAALGHKGLGVVITAADAENVSLLEEALGGEPGLEGALRARLLGALALELQYADVERSRELSSQAVELARAEDDPRPSPRP
jgi:tetratricopeptide (TPR) repeat protein